MTKKAVIEKELNELKTILPNIATVEVDLLDFYAGCALIGYCMGWKDEWTTNVIAAKCFGMAEAMIRERKKYDQASSEDSPG